MSNEALLWVLAFMFTYLCGFITGWMGQKENGSAKYNKGYHDGLEVKEMRNNEVVEK